jgi:hypothetical protein
MYTSSRTDEKGSQSSRRQSVVHYLNVGKMTLTLTGDTWKGVIEPLVHPDAQKVMILTWPRCASKEIAKQLTIMIEVQHADESRVNSYLLQSGQIQIPCMDKIYRDGYASLSGEIQRYAWCGEEARKLCTFPPSIFTMLGKAPWHQNSGALAN